MTNEDDFKEAVMLYGVVGVESPSYDVTGLYINEVKFGSRFSNVFMFGSLYGVGVNSDTVYQNLFASSTNAGFLINDSLFYHFTSSLVVGIEMLFFGDIVDNHTSIGFYPQVLFVITESLSLHVGVGLNFEITGIITPYFLMRIIS